MTNFCFSFLLRWLCITLNAHMGSTPSLNSLSEVALETLRTLVWLNTNHSIPTSKLRVSAAYFSTPVCLQALSLSTKFLRDGSAQAILRAATMRWKLSIKLAISPSNSILTPGQQLLELIPRVCQGTKQNASLNS